jgi:hypothetical protein
VVVGTIINLQMYCILKFSVNNKMLRFQFLTSFTVDMNWDRPQVCQILGFLKELSPKIYHFDWLVQNNCRKCTILKR